MIFILEGTAIFEAENIDDAFIKLSEHFKFLSEGEDGIEMLGGTTLELRKR